MQCFNSACEIQLDLMAVAAAIVQPSADAKERLASKVAPISNETHVARTGQKEWTALLRCLDREDESQKC